MLNFIVDVGSVFVTLSVPYKFFGFKVYKRFAGTDKFFFLFFVKVFFFLTLLVNACEILLEVFY